MRHVLEIFEGYVVEVNDNSFWGRYEDFDGNLEEAEFITDKVLFTDEDKDFLQVGTYFVMIFYNDDSFDFNLIKEYWTQEQIDEAQKEAEILIKKFRGLPDVDND